MLADLADDPRPSGVTKMAGAKDRYRIRTGDYRIVYQISDDIRWVEVIGIGTGWSFTGTSRCSCYCSDLIGSAARW
jgi:hypothetical protein